MAAIRRQQRRIGSSMAEQLDRVNGRGAAAVPSLSTFQTDSSAEVERLREQLRDARREIEALQSKIDMLTSAADANSWTSKRGRRVCTPAYAADMLGVSVSTINRYLSEGIIEGEQGEGKKGRWQVYADSLKRKPRKSRKKGT